MMSRSAKEDYDGFCRIECQMYSMLLTKQPSRNLVVTSMIRAIGYQSKVVLRSNLFVTHKDQEPAIGDSSSNYSFGISLREGSNPSQGTLPNISTWQKSPVRQYQPDSPRTRPTGDDPNIANHIEALIKEYTKARGGIASSRDIGRYLAANAAYTTSGKSESANGVRKTALQQLKENYGSLASYLSMKHHVFQTVSQNLVDTEEAIYPSSKHAFGVKLK